MPLLQKGVYNKMKLKFRCWNGETMINPDCIDRDGIAHWKENSVPESTNKVMAWTGLLDKRGMEIYEGDIVIKDNGSKGYSDPMLIMWEGTSFIVKPNRMETFHREMVIPLFHTAMRVIGNIYKNPELLKEVK
jgi:hypothetical protein